MNAQFYQSASYVPPGGMKAGKQQRQEQWDEFQRQEQSQSASMGDVPANSSSKTSTRRKRADSHQPTSSHSQHSADASHPELDNIPTHVRASHDYDERPRRFSSADAGYADNLSPQLSPSSPYSEVRRISGNFNAPTEIELERTREHRKSLKGMEKLRSRVKGWVRT